jgi:hypothetical protein
MTAAFVRSWSKKKGLSLFCWVEANVQLDVKEHFDFA